MNFPGFLVDQAFLIGFRYDLRRAASDPNHALFVVERYREPVAFLWVVTHENSWTGERSGYVNNIYVAPAVRGRGVAKFLMAQCEEHFQRLGIMRIRLEVTESNEAAVQLYRAMGYEVTRFVMEKETEEPGPFATGRDS
jgi:ribosomal protein S18 acetylase RimI-like enzyme